MLTVDVGFERRKEVFLQREVARDGNDAAPGLSKT